MNDNCFGDLVNTLADLEKKRNRRINLISGALGVVIGFAAAAFVILTS